MITCFFAMNSTTLPIADLLESEHEIYILAQEDGWHFFYVRAPSVN